MIEGYYIESHDGLFFAVKGVVHPPQAVVAYLRYIPDPDGDREKGGVRYRRLYDFGEQEKLLRDRYAPYLFFDPAFGEWLQGVPHERIRRVHDPCLKLADLRRREGLGEPEETAVEFADLLAARAQVQDRSIGVSGSVLVGTHTPHSDVDVVVYGTVHCRAVHRALRELLDEPGQEVRRLSEEEMRALYAARSQDTPMTFQDFVGLERRKVNQGQFRGREYFVRFVKDPAEVGESYGDRRYTSLGQAEIEATVADASEAIFTPCSYKIMDVQFLADQRAQPQFAGLLVKEIASFRGRFCEQARVGERIVAKGKLEQVVLREGKVYHRLLLGGRGDSMVVKDR